MIKKFLILSLTLLFVAAFLIGCQSSKDVVAETNEKLLVNENVTIENFEKIEIGNPKTGEGGMTYEKVLELMGDMPPQSRSEIISEDGSSEVEATWRRYSRSQQYGTDLIGVKFINGKAFSKFEELE